MFSRHLKQVFATIMVISFISVNIPGAMIYAATPTGTQNNTHIATSAKSFKPVSAAAGQTSEPATKTLTKEEQGSLKAVFGTEPVTSKTVTENGSTNVTYYDKDGNVIGTSKQSAGSSDVRFYDKSGAEITGKFVSLTSDQQAALSKIFSAAPVTSKAVTADGITTTTYYDADGNKIGTSKTVPGSTSPNTIQYFDKDNKQITVGADKLSLPAKPGDNATQAEWTKYFNDYLTYIGSLTDNSAKKTAWNALAADIKKLSADKPDMIAAATMSKINNALANELKEKYRNADYKIDLSSAQAAVVEANLNFIKSDAFKDMDDTKQNSVSGSFTTLAVELSWRSANNSANKALYPKIGEFFKTMIENGSETVKAVAFNRLMHLYRVDSWSSKEGNKDVANQILKEALKFKDGIKGLLSDLQDQLNNKDLEADQRGQIACALSNILYHQDALEKQGGTEFTSAQISTLTKKLTGFLDGINDDSIKVSGGIRNSLIHLLGSSINHMINGAKQDTADNKALINSFISMSKDSFLLSNDDGGSTGLRSSAINVLNSIYKNSLAKKDNALAGRLKAVLLDKDFDVSAFISQARNEAASSKNADWAAYVNAAMANLAKLNIENGTGKITAADVKNIIKDISAWVSNKDNLNNMRVMAWQKLLYEALSDLAKELYKKDSKISVDDSVGEDLAKALGTINGLKDSLVQSQAVKDVEDLTKSMRDNGFKDLANKIDLAFCDSSEDMLKKAWAFYDSKDMESAKVFANEAIKRWEDEALKQQASLSDYAKAGEESKYWALNDVATAYFILGEIARKDGDKAKAKEYYQKIVDKLGFAQCYDPANKSYWKVKDAAKKALDEL